MKRGSRRPSALAAGKGATEAIGPNERPLIPEEWRGLVEDLLVAGLAVEDIVEAVLEKNGPVIKEGAILSHFRTHPDLQKRRVENTVSGVEKLAGALGNPEADHALTQLANSALMVGYMGLTKKRANSITIKDAEVIRLSRENLQLRKQYLKLKEVGQARTNQLLDKRLRFEDVKHDKACEELKKLRGSLGTLMREGKLEQNTLNKIKEIYGIVQQPFIEEIANEQTAQN